MQVSVGSGSGLNGALDGVSLAVLGGYLAAVAFHGNIQAFWPLLLDTKSYLEFVSAAGILYGLYNWGDGAPVVPALITGGLIAMLIKFAMNHQNVAAQMDAFYKGQDMFVTIGNILKG